MKIYTKEQGDELLKELNSLKNYLMAHPDNQPNSECADKIEDVEHIEEVFKAAYDSIEYARKLLLDKNKESLYKNK